MLATLKQSFSNWLFRPGIEHGAIVLTQRGIFILPTRQGWALGLLLSLMLLGCINYNLSLGYVLTFLLSMMAVLSMLHAFRNLAQLEIHPGHCDDVFSGQPAKLLLHFSSRLPRYQLVLRGENGDSVIFDMPASQDYAVEFPLRTARRGWLETGRLTLYTEFPLGLFHAWSYLHFDARCLVYPRPLPDAPLPTGNAPDGAGRRSIAGDDDFAGLRTYVAGDALPHIAWKSYARGLGLQVKQFTTPVGAALWLNLDDAPETGLEDKLSHLTRQVLEAEAQGLRYGLSLPDGELPADGGSAHRDACLRRLALFGLP